MKLIAIILVVLACATPGLAQVTSANIIGTVTDRSGAVVPGAEVKAVQVETNITRESVTDASGQYALRLLPIGQYRVLINGKGFKQFEQRGITLDVNRTARVDAVMEIGALSESVSVTSDAPLVNTAEASLGRTVDSREIESLPLVGRNVYGLLSLTPGVDTTATSEVFGAEVQNTVITGSPNPTGAVAYYLDGGNNTGGQRNAGNPSPNPDAIQEFRVIINGFSAEFGRFGGGIVDVVTKSGTNEIHGSVFEFLRNDKLNANNWKVLSRAMLRRNQFGFTLGGPVIRNKLFAFGSYGGLRQKQSTIKTNARVPTALERNGDFSQSVANERPFDPLSSAPFPSSLIPASRVDKVARNLLDKYVPASNMSDGRFYAAASPRDANNNEFLIKGDYVLNNKHQVAASLFKNKGLENRPLSGSLPWTVQEAGNDQYNANLGDTWTISPTMVNQVRLTYMRYFGARTNNPPQSIKDLGGNFDIQGAASLPDINLANWWQFGTPLAGTPAGSNYYGLREILTWSKGRHSIKAGGEFALEKFIHAANLNNFGRISLDGRYTRNPSVSATNSYADFMLGMAYQNDISTPVDKFGNTWYNGLYFQDDIRIASRLTLNLGLRYELQTMIVDPQNRVLLFKPGVKSATAPTAPLGLLVYGDPGVGRGAAEGDHNNFAPRVGVAWDPFGKGRTSVRAGAGVYYGSISGNEFNMTMDRMPYTFSQIFRDVTLTNPLGSVKSPFPYYYNPQNPVWKVGALPSTFAVTDAKFRINYTYQLNFSVQHQVRSDTSITAAYVSQMTHKAPNQAEWNYPAWRPGATTRGYDVDPVNGIDARRPNLPGTMSTIMALVSNANAAYHGFQLTGEKRYSHNFSLKGFYTFSKGIDTISNTGAWINGIGAAVDPRRFDLERGRTGVDRRHNFVLAALWEINYFRGMHPVARHILGDWTISAVASARAGTPLTITQGADVNMDGQNNDRPNRIAFGALDPNRTRAEVENRWFDTAAFTANTVTGSLGTSGRSILDGPGQKNVDMSIFRIFRIREGMNLQFRAEATNAFNIVNLGGPNTSLSAGQNFGRITGAGGMRVGQLGLRLEF